MSHSTNGPQRTTMPPRTIGRVWDLFVSISGSLVNFVCMSITHRFYSWTRFDSSFCWSKCFAVQSSVVILKKPPSRIFVHFFTQFILNRLGNGKRKMATIDWMIGFQFEHTTNMGSLKCRIAQNLRISTILFAFLCSLGPYWTFSRKIRKMFGWLKSPVTGPLCGKSNKSTSIEQTMKKLRRAFQMKPNTSQPY